MNPKSAFEIWNDVPENDVDDLANKKIWIRGDETMKWEEAFNEYMNKNYPDVPPHMINIFKNVYR